ncbi:MAG: glycogen/starch/alpha-glucan phosphorylase, partial [Alphaproteobacteria bacterium]
RRVYYLSMEFMIGRIIEDALRNIGLYDAAQEALAAHGVDMHAVMASEPDPALGNGGLGRLAACYMESMATLGISGFGYGIRYKSGLFKQSVEKGWQIEEPDDWTSGGSFWEFPRSEVAYDIGFMGTTRQRDKAVTWTPGETVEAMANDFPIIGWQGKSAATLRLWSARSKAPLNMAAFDQGDYLGAYRPKIMAEAISQVLYPNDSTEQGKRLRLSQEYFFSAASIKDIIRRYLSNHSDLRNLPDKVTIQLNDTHPAIAIPEFVRLLMDDHGVSLGEAFELAQRTFNYTNHTLLPEALETWHVGLVGDLLPRHMQLIYEINARVLSQRRADAGNHDPYLSDVSLIEEHGGGYVRMGHLAFIGSRRTNGVSALHSELVEGQLFRNLGTHFPGKITNVTNGVTPRRWLNGCNPALARFVTDAVGEGWQADLERLRGLEALADDASAQDRFAAVKRENKVALARFIAQDVDIAVSPDALFDSQIKRIHEYKRQLLNVLHAIALYLDIKDRGVRPIAPTVKIFSGKAAASYTRAKEIIRLIHGVAKTVNDDPAIGDALKVVFLPNYRVSTAELIIPATDLSEQISTAGMEASGTGNMKFALNGALTIGTLDGANVEIREHVGADNIEIFGLTAEEVHERRLTGQCPTDLSDPLEMRARVLDAIATGTFGMDVAEACTGLINDLTLHDYFLVMADFDAYLSAQGRVETSFQNPVEWTRRTMLNTARMGWFSSDRSITDYARNIWDLPEDSFGL